MNSFADFLTNYLGPIQVVVGIVLTLGAVLALILFRESDGVITYAYFVPKTNPTPEAVTGASSSEPGRNPGGHFVVVIANQWETEHPGPLHASIWPRSGKLNPERPLQLRFGPLNASAKVTQVDERGDQYHEVTLPTGLPPFRMLAIDIDAAECANLEVKVTLPRPWYTRWLNVVVDRVVPSIDAAGLFHAVGHGARLRVASSATWVELGPKLARFHRARERWSAITATVTALVAFALTIRVVAALRSMKAPGLHGVDDRFLESQLGVGVWPFALGAVLIVLATWSAYSRGSVSFVMAEPYRIQRDPFRQPDSSHSKGIL